MKTVKNMILKALALSILVVPSVLTPMALADPICTDNSPSCGGPSGNPTPVTSSDNCSDTTTNGTVSQAKVNSCLKNSHVVVDIQNIVNFLSAAVGVVIIAMIIVGGIQYSLAGDNPGALEAARKRITNAVIALFAFMFAFAFLQWLIPGGIFS